MLSSTTTITFNTSALVTAVMAQQHLTVCTAHTLDYFVLVKRDLKTTYILVI